MLLHDIRYAFRSMRHTPGFTAAGTLITQAVDSIALESSYDRKSGETTIEERQYDSYATLFKRAPEHKGMLLMVSPRDGEVEATVEICSKKK